ncbi:MAG: hypothetical protein Q4E62_08560, partial [Sutterellaceae bacterium]|nr:hypothetical protein [Sutterellaceae bacterium]
MSDIAGLLHGLFATLIVFYVCLQVALTIFEVKNEEGSANAVPVAFRQRITLAEHRKAVDYTGEVIQSDLVHALLGAGLALILTFGNGFTLLLAGTTAVFGQGVGAQFALVCVVVVVLAVIDLPISWWKDFRINERYGFERTPAKQWLQDRVLETLVGCVVALPILLGFTIILMSSSYHWWLFALFVTVSWYIWRIYLVSNWFVGFGANVKPMADSPLKEKIAHLLAKTGFEGIEICTADRPRAWRHGHALLAKRPGKKRLVIFNHVFDGLDDDEILAVAACAIGRVNRWHNFAKFFFFTMLAFGFWWGFAKLAEIPAFYRALNIEPALAIPNGTVNPGLLFALGLTIIPVALYPVVFAVHAFTRMLTYDEDAYAVREVGARVFVRAIAKLHRDYRNSLTPNRLYSLANHRRPHVTHRIESALLTETRDRR